MGPAESLVLPVLADKKVKRVLKEAEGKRARTGRTAKKVRLEPMAPQDHLEQRDHRAKMEPMDNPGQMVKTVKRVPMELPARRDHQARQVQQAAIQV